MEKIKEKEISLTVQGQVLQSYFPDSSFSIGGNILVWKGYLKPTELSPSYLIKIVYQREKDPNVYVLEPRSLLLAEGKKNLNMYMIHPNNICVYIERVRKNGTKISYLPRLLSPGLASGYCIMNIGLLRVYGMVVEYINSTFASPFSRLA